jgi:hypothetical protein
VSSIFYIYNVCGKLNAAIIAIIEEQIMTGTLHIAIIEEQTMTGTLHSNHRGTNYDGNVT